MKKLALCAALLALPSLALASPVVNIRPHHLGGGEDAISVKAVANASQTAAVLQATTSAGVNLLSVDNSGNVDCGASGRSATVDIFPATAAKGKFTLSCSNQTNDTAVTLNANAMGQATQINLADPGVASSYLVQSTAAVSLAEMDVLDGVTPGTVAANKAVVVDSNKRVDDLDITALEIANIDITATGTEINNALDISAQLQAITSAGAVTVDGSIRRATLSGGAYAITLDVPGAAAIGAILVIEYTGGDTDAVTLALTNVIGESGGTTATFNADGEGMVFIGTALGWVVLKEFGGVTLA